MSNTLGNKYKEQAITNSTCWDSQTVALAVSCLEYQVFAVKKLRFNYYL